MIDLKGKRILITSYSYASFGGAELNAVELADQLIQFGMKPTFFSYDINGPLKKHIEERFNTVVLTDKVYNLAESDRLDDMGYIKLNIDDYDYIWIGGNTIPISIVRQLRPTKKLPKFIFIHMSQLVAFPLDAPLMPTLEEKVASVILSISEKTTTDNIQRILNDHTTIDTWPNPVPRGFKNLKKRSGKLRKVAIISSSHPSGEVMSAMDIIERNGIKVDYIGKFNNNVKVVNENFYDEYDLIIGIGKNARYSLVSGVPIYIYGRFGGGGYISKDNLDLNEMYNFSGRGFSKKDAKTIANEVITGYNAALKFHEINRKRFIEELSLDSVARNLFMRLEEQKNKTVKLDKSYINWLVSIQITIMQWRQLSATLRNSVNKTKELESQNKQIQNDLNEIQGELRDVYKSHSWTATKPIRAMAAVIKRLIIK